MEQDLVERSDDTAVASGAANAVEAEAGELVDELLIEEISIDGMCGVY